MSLEIGRVYATVDGDTRLFSRSMGFVRKEGESTARYVARQFNQVGDAFQSVGKKLTAGLTLPIVGLGTASLLSFGKLESALSKVEGLVGIASDQLAGMREELLRMAPEVGRVPQELAEGLFFVTSAGFRGAEAMDILRISAKAAAAGLGETNTIADLVTSAMKAYGTENLNAAQATDILTAAVREGKAEAPELAQALGQVLPISSELGISFDQVAAAVAAMTRTGTDAQTATTQLRQIMASLLKPTSDAEKVLDDFSLSAAGLRKQIRDEGLLSVLQMLRTRFGDNEEAMSRVFGNIRALSGVLDLVGANAEENAKIFEALTDSTGALDHAFDVASDTLEFKWNAALASSKVLLIEVGDVVKDAVLPVLNSLNKILQDSIQFWRDLSPEVRRLAISIAGVTATIGPLLFAIGTASKVIAIAVSGFTALAGAVTAANIAMLANPYVALGAAIVTLGTHIFLTTKRIKRLNDEIERALSMDVTGQQDEHNRLVKAFLDLTKRRNDLEKTHLELAGHVNEAGRRTLAQMDSERQALALKIQESRRMMMEQEKLNNSTKEATENQRENAKAVSNLTEEIQGCIVAFEELDHLFKGTDELFQGLELVPDLFTDIGEAIEFAALAADGMHVSIAEVNAALALVQQAHSEAYGSDRRAELEELIASLEGLLATMTGAKEETVQLGQGAQFAMQIANEFTNSFGQGMANVIVQGEKLVDTLRNIGKLLASAVIQKGISLLLSGGLSGGGFLGSGGGLIGSIFGRRASGGTTMKGLPHLVGERGPEVFVPNVTGTIAPIAAGSSSITVNLAPRLVPIIGYDGLAVRLEQSTANIARRGGV